MRVHAATLGVELDLALGVRLLAKLAEHLDALADAGRADRVPEADEAARRVGRQVAAQVEDALLSELSALSRLAEPEVLVGD